MNILLFKKAKDVKYKFDHKYLLKTNEEMFIPLD